MRRNRSRENRKLAKAKGEGKIADSVARDVEPAFDEVQHRLTQLEMDDKLIHFLCNFLTDRKVYIQMDEYIGLNLYLEKVSSKAATYRERCVRYTRIITRRTL